MLLFVEGPVWNGVGVWEDPTVLLSLHRRHTACLPSRDGHYAMARGRTANPKYPAYVG